MNAELVAGGQERLIIPTAYRVDYLGGLKALSQTGNPTPVIRMLDHAQRYTHTMDWSSLGAAQVMLAETGAFTEGENARLKLPMNASV